MKLIVEKIIGSAKLPTKSHDGDLAYDLYALDYTPIDPSERALVRTGIRVRFPEGWGGKIFDRSGTALNKGLLVMAGVIDNGYRGEIKVLLCNTSRLVPSYVNAGDRIAQMVPIPVVNWDIEEGKVDIEETSRGETGFGASGQ